jgi:hypothetical protein
MTTVCKLCDEVTEGPCGDMECPQLDPPTEKKAPLFPPHWTAERKLRSAVCILEGACDAALRLATMSDDCRTSIQEAVEYAKQCKA